MEIQKKLPQNQLGVSDITVSALGLGTVKFGRDKGLKYPEGFSLPNDKEMLNILSVAKQGGMNLLDTAPAYGTSEERLGKLLKNSRKDWVICSKAGEEFVDGRSSYHFSEKKIRSSVERSLRRLNTDYLDIVLIHSDGDDLNIINGGALYVLNELKKQGKIRATGMSTKTVEGGILAAQQSDCVMVTHNLQYSGEKSVIDYCFEHKKGVLLKKIFASGHIQNPNAEQNSSGKRASKSNIDATMEFVFKSPGVSSAIIGSINPTHIIENINAACRYLEK